MKRGSGGKDVSMTHRKRRKGRNEERRKRGKAWRLGGLAA